MIFNYKIGKDFVIIEGYYGGIKVLTSIPSNPKKTFRERLRETKALMKGKVDEALSQRGEVSI